MLKLNRKQSEWMFYVSLTMISMAVFLLVGEPGYVLFDDSKTYMNINNNMDRICEEPVCVEILGSLCMLCAGIASVYYGYAGGNDNS